MAILLKSASSDDHTPPKRLPLPRRKLVPLFMLVIVALVGLQFHDKWHRKKESILSFSNLQSATSMLNKTKPNIAATSSGDILMDCKLERGNRGKWVQDFEMANRTHYRIPRGGYFDWQIPELNFQPTREHPFRWATTWKWQDDHCPVSEITKEAFCDVIWDLNIRQFLIMGDSLSIEFGVSFLSLLGKVLGPQLTGFSRIRKVFVLKCPAIEAPSIPNKNTTATTTEKATTSIDKNNEKKKKKMKKKKKKKTNKEKNIIRPKFSFKILIMRRSPIADLMALCGAAKDVQDSSAWDASYYRNYLLPSKDDDFTKSAIIFNTGAWIQGGLEEYKTGFQCMVEWIDSLQRNQQQPHNDTPNRILAFFRPTSRNHFDCLPQLQSSNNNETELQEAFNYTGNPIQQSPHASLDEYYKVTEIATNSSSPVARGTYITADGVKFGKNWKDIEAYNNYSKHYLDDRQEKQQQQQHRRVTSDSANSGATCVPIYWLNTYYSSALRRDGHMGFGDCLHYALPGPIDWWVHFFYSLLLDLRQERKAHQAENRTWSIDYRSRLRSGGWQR